MPQTNLIYTKLTVDVFFLQLHNMYTYNMIEKAIVKYIMYIYYYVYFARVNSSFKRLIRYFTHK